MEELEGYFKALADISRLRIINLLLHGELCGCDIQRVLDAPQPNVSRHLTYLKHAGLVRDRREGFRVYYRLPEPPSGHLRELFQFLRGAFERERTLCDDLLSLQRAIKDGACTIQNASALAKTSPDILEADPRG
ncbi:MAG: metalloregulator ArsR/SmtB family transcription factor [Acidobacteriia bacterium]|nr:metalloregulator ArsR/SmtB family transcription factor [Terriglobia bacterium]